MTREFFYCPNGATNIIYYRIYHRRLDITDYKKAAIPSSPHLLVTGVDGLVKGPEQDLSQVEDTGVGCARLDEFVEHVVRDGCLRLVVGRHAPQRLGLPAPVLQHLGRRLHEVTLH